MIKDHLAFRSLAYLGIAIALGLTPLGVNADAPAPRKAQALFEIKWMKNMIDHHHMAVMMAELCVDRAVHPELIAMCHDIQTAQTQEIEEMQMWLQDWYGVQYEPQMSPGGEKMIARMAQMEGEEFEIAFMESMIRHHLRAITEGKLALRRAYHPELKDMAAEMIEMQSAEILQLREWLCDWYNRCHGPGQQLTSRG